MKTNYLLPIRYVFAIMFMSFLFQLPAQNALIAASDQLPVIPEASDIRSSASSGCDYILDDGITDINIGLGAAGDFMWLNSFTAIPGCENIHMVSIIWGNVPNGTATRIILYDDLDNDGNPSDAVYLAEISVNITDANTGLFVDYPFPATTVTDGYFVAVLTENQPWDIYAAALDMTVSNMSSYFVESYTGGAIDVSNLMNNDTPPTLVEDVGFPGNWIVRAQGEPVLPVPLSNAGIILGFLLMGTIVVFGRKLI